MDLHVLISKKGTKVVTAVNLHQVLQLNNAHYVANVRKWLEDVYEFRDGIRKPEELRDYGRRKSKDNPIVEDYYLSVELAKLITLNSRSKVKQKYAKWLLTLEDQVENAELLTKEQVLAVLQLSKVMGLVSCQETSERQHVKTYRQQHQGSAANWWNYREQVLGYSMEEVENKLKNAGLATNGRSMRKMLMQVDKHEMVRTGVIDLFMAMGKNERYARNLGDLAKVFAEELKVEIFDDRNAAPAFLPPVDPELAGEIRSFEKGKTLSLWP